MAGKNPLAVKQRETAGAETFGKYDYQYHWALCRLLGQHLDKPEYAIFVECHEDVVVADSLDAKKAKFEFNQIKCKETSPFTVSTLTSIPKKSKNSVLGKLVSSSKDKPFKDAISTINLVATNGFHKDIVANGLKLQVITTADMNADALASLLEKLKKELDVEEVPANIRFVIPELPSSGHREYVVGKIAELIDEIFPQSSCKPANIYRLLIDELYKKGQVQYDFTQWDDLLKNKALTSETVKSVVAEHTSIGGLDETKTAVDAIAKELGLKTRVTARLKKAVERYYGAYVAQPSAPRFKLAQIVEETASKMPHLEYADLVKYLEENLEQSVKKLFGDAQGLRAAIIYELIQVDK